MASYQYMSALSYHEIHLIRFICRYCIFIYKNMSFYYVLLIIITKLYLSHKFLIKWFVILCKIMFCCRQVHLRPPESFNCWHKAKHWKIMKYQGSDDCCEGYRDSDLNLLASVILWQYTTVTNSVKYCPGPERDIFSISTDDLISRSALLGFSILRVSYYYNLTELVCYIYSVTISKVTPSYQDSSSVSYRKINLLWLICSYCTLIFNEYVIF